MTTTTTARLRLLLLPALVAAGLLALPSRGSAEPFGISKFENAIEEEGGSPSTQAGSHPYSMTTTLEFATHPVEGNLAPTGSVKNLEVNCRRDDR